MPGMGVSNNWVDQATDNNLGVILRRHELVNQYPTQNKAKAACNDKLVEAWCALFNADLLAERAELSHKFQDNLADMMLALEEHSGLNVIGTHKTADLEKEFPTKQAAVTACQEKLSEAWNLILDVRLLADMAGLSTECREELRDIMRELEMNEF